MASPVDEKMNPFSRQDRSSHEEATHEEATIISNGSARATTAHQNNLRVDTLQDSTRSLDMQSPAQSRERASRLDDDLRILQAERQASHIAETAEQARQEKQQEPEKSDSVQRVRTRRVEPIDEFDAATNPIHERTHAFKPPANPRTATAKFFKRVHGSGWMVRFVVYITLPVLIILIPLLLGAMLFTNSTVGGVKLVWFCIWLEIVWLTLWAGRILAKILPSTIGFFTSLFTDNAKKWRDMVKQLELPATLFFWWLGIEVSFLPTMINHHHDGNRSVRSWENTMNKVLVSFFVAAILNFIEKIIIQLIAISFHTRAYEQRIATNRFQYDSLAKLYRFSKAKISMADSDFEAPSGGHSGAITPGLLLRKAQIGTKEAVSKFGDFAGRIKGDFTGKPTHSSSHPSQVVISLLSTTAGSQVLARRLYRTFARPVTETIHQEDLTDAFENQEEADAAFTMFDRDMNGDISMEEMEAACVEIGRERKSITASLKDLDSVVSKLDNCFLFLVLVISVLVFISLISTSAAGVLTSAGSTILALSWLFQATAQEFLQSLIFVFVKHPFDVGDRVTIYGNTGPELKGDDYFVKKISLLYTEFKKLPGQVVQAPNNYLNTLFILNHRRSGGLAEAIPLVVKFGTTIEQIDNLRQRLVEFVMTEKREYQENILTELREIREAHSITINVVFFFKSNWQNELLRLQRRNKFICALMVTMQELEIEGPRMRYPGQRESFPVYMQHIPFSSERAGRQGHPDNPLGGFPLEELTMDGTKDRFALEDIDEEEQSQPSDIPVTRSETQASAQLRHHSGRPRGASITGRARGESIAEMGRRLDFSLGMSSISSGDVAGDVFEDRTKPRIPFNITSAPGPHVAELRSRSSDRQRTSIDTGRSTSRAAPMLYDTALQRRATDGSPKSSTLHRNRIFGRFGSTDDRRMESGMAGIPGGIGRSATQQTESDTLFTGIAATRWNTVEGTSRHDTDLGR